MINPITDLALFAQKKWKGNIETEVIGKTGKDHKPRITVRITLPNGLSFEGSGTSKKDAKQKLSTKILENWDTE